MTGFGRGELERNGHSFVVEIKSVNHRYLDMNIRSPRVLLFLEDDVRNVIKTGEPYRFNVNGTDVELADTDLLIEPVQREGFVVESEGDMAVIIDTHITKELEEEGNVREIVSKIQTMRKEAGFEVTDHIRISVTEGEAVQKVFTDNMERILSDTLADEGSVEMMEGYSKEWDINGIRAVFVIVKA